jgi:FdhD protein
MIFMNFITLSHPHSITQGEFEDFRTYDEIPTAIFINGRHLSTLLLAPGDQKEYITGFLLTEQHITKKEEIESIRVEKNRISIITTNIFTSPGPKKTILSGCGGAVSYIDTGKLPILSSNFSVSENAIDDCIRKIHSEKEICSYGLVFSCLCQEDGLLLYRCDITDDQSLDRMIGAAFTKEINLTSSFCVCSATITSESVRKCLIARIPLIITIGYCTSLAVEIGRKNGLGIGVVHDETIMIYSTPERISR